MINGAMSLLVWAHQWQLGSVQYYTIQRFTPALIGRIECRGTLFPASVTREIGG